MPDLEQSVMEAMVEAIAAEIWDPRVYGVAGSWKSLPINSVWRTQTLHVARRALRAALRQSPSAAPVAVKVKNDFFIQEREDDMLICAPDWQFGNRCIARRPRMVTNDEWRPIAERIIAALSAAPPTGGAA